MSKMEVVISFEVDRSRLGVLVQAVGILSMLEKGEWNVVKMVNDFPESCGETTVFGTWLHSCKALAQVLKDLHDPNVKKALVLRLHRIATDIVGGASIDSIKFKEPSNEDSTASRESECQQHKTEESSDRAVEIVGDANVKDFKLTM